jgi:gliding motility-associated-like protein
VRVTGPNGGFTATPSVICSGGTISFHDVNVDPGAIITSRFWNFNGGMPPGLTPTPASAYYTGAAGTTVSVTFPEGSYLVSLRDTDNVGCTSYDTMRIRSVHPHAYFYTSDSLLRGCIGHVYNFHDTNTHCSYSWNFGAGWTTPSATARDTFYTYSANGTFSVGVRIYADGTGLYPAGCNDSMTRTGYVHIYPMNVAMNLLSPAAAICPPLNIIALNNTSPYSGNTYYWTITPPAGAPTVYTTSPNFLSASFGAPSGDYTVMLTGYNALGCRDSAIQTVSLHAPSGVMTVTSDSGCAPRNICFHYTDTTGSIFAGNFIWDFGAAGALISTNPDTCFLYTTPGIYAPPTVLITTTTCATQVLSYDSIRIFPTPIVNVTHPGLLCHGQTTKLVATGADSYTWTASNGGLSCFTCDSVIVSPTVNDTIIVTGSTIHGCQDTGYTVIRIDSALHVRVHGKDSVCIGSCDKLYVTGISGGTYTWQSVPGISCSVCDTNLICPTATHTYRVVGQDLAGCKDSTSFTVTVHYPPVVTVSPDPMYVCKPAGKQMTASVDAASVSAKYLWTPRLGLSCDSCAAPVASPTSNTIYTVVATSKWGCKDSITVPVTVYDTTATSIRADTTICFGDRARLWATGGIGYQWMPDSGKIANPNAYTTYVQPAHTTIFTVNITENVCFSNTLSMKVTVIPTPGLHMPPGQSILAGNTIQLIPTMSTPQNVSYLWTPADSTISCFDCPHPFVTPSVSPTTYVLHVSTIEGCHAEDSVTIHLFCQSSQIFIPNTFTPNGDGVNDWFHVSGKGLGLVKRMSIYNRWGQIVYEAHDINANNPGEGWNGTFNGAILEPDVFVYIIDVLCETGEPYSFKGDVTLMR